MVRARRIPTGPLSPGKSDPMSLKETSACADVVLRLILTDADFRRKYYNVSRSWHKSYAVGGRRGGNFKSTWLDLLTSKLPDEYANMTLQDFANVHAHMFYTLQRAVLAITAHNIDRDAIDNPNKPHPEGFHWVPNDGVDPSYSPGAMGFSKVAP